MNATESLDPMPRLPAAELEAAVPEQLRDILRAPGMVAEVVAPAVDLDPTLDEAQVTVAMTRLDAIWDQLFPAEQQRLVLLLVEKVIVSSNHIEVRPAGQRRGGTWLLSCAQPCQ